MKMPKVLKQHQKLEKFVGNWIGEEKIHPSPFDPVGGVATSKVKTKSTLDGFFVCLEYTQKQGKQVSYRGYGMFGWDAINKQYTKNWFDNMGGGSMPATGQWTGNKLVLEHVSPMGHARYTFTMSKPDAYKMTIEHSETGEKWMTFMEGAYKKI